MEPRAGQEVRLSWPGRKAPRPPSGARLEVRWSQDGEGGQAGRLIQGDNLQVMVALLEEGLEGRFTLIYLDPPYGTAAEFSLRGSGTREVAYRDQWGEHGLRAYLDHFHQRLPLVRRLLSPEGTLYVHLDRRACHYVQVLLDEVFGRECCRNVIVWRREVARGRKAYARHFGNNTEFLLCYTRRAGGGVWNPVDGERLISREEAERHFRRDERGYYSTSHRGTYSDQSLLSLAREGRLYVTRGGQLVSEGERVGTTKGTIRVKYYLEPRGEAFVKRYAVDNLWDDIRGIAEAGRERCGYPTQKPERLLERIISASSRPGDLVGDFYAGSGTTGVVSARLGRPWVMADASPAAVAVCEARLKQQAIPFTLETVKRSRRGR